MLAIAILLYATLCAVRCDVIELSCKDIRQFVDEHNSIRLRVARGYVSGQPAASDMAMLVWDQELADTASQWAANDVYEHNPNRHLDRFDFGENLYWTGESGNDNTTSIINKAVNAWFKENEDYTFGAIGQTESIENIGHYTQMVWAKSTYLGCAISNYYQNSCNNYLVFCDYGPAGNVEDTEPYQSSYDNGNRWLVCDSDNCNNCYGGC